MPQRIALTGGIGSGKSYVCQTIARTGAPIFYADDEAKRIIFEYMDLYGSDT